MMGWDNQAIAEKLQDLLPPELLPLFRRTDKAAILTHKKFCQRCRQKPIPI